MAQLCLAVYYSLVMGGVYLQYSRDNLMGSQIYIGFRIYPRKVNWPPDRHGQWGIK